MKGMNEITDAHIFVWRATCAHRLFHFINKIYTGINFHTQLVDDCSQDNDGFWRTTGRVGVDQSQKRRIPMEVVLEDGSISRGSAVVLEKWTCDLFSLLNCQTDNNPQTDNNTSQQSNAAPLEPVFNAYISVFGVKTAIDGAKRGKHAESMLFQLRFYATMHLFPSCTYYSMSSFKRALFPLSGANAS